MTHAMRKRFRLAEDVARDAGALALRFFHDQSELQVETKGPQDVVSRADREVEALIRRRILEAFPDDAILGEEAGGSVDLSSDQPIWIIDPIDGTQCFLHGLSTWCISIALVHDRDTVLGVIHDPCANELFIGGPAIGASCNGAPVRVTEASDFTAGMMEIGYSTRTTPDMVLAVLSRLLAAGGMYHRCGAGALALAHVAAGRYIGYFEEHMNAWDSLAGAALVRGAGGWTNDLLSNDGLNQGAMVVAGSHALEAPLRAVVGTDFGPVVGPAVGWQG